MPDILRQRDIGAVFRFLKSRGWSRAAIAASAGLSETRVREILRGKQLVSSYDVLERIALGLNIDRGLLGVAYGADPDSPGREQSVVVPAANLGPYTDFVGALAGIAVGATPPELDRLLPPAVPLARNLPSIVTPAHVEMLREISEHHRLFDANHGGGSCRDSAAAYLRWAQGMRHGRFSSESTQHALIGALSDMYQVVGWASHDLGDHAEARRYLTAGLVLAREINDLVLISGAFYRLGRVSIHQGRADEALKLWQLGQIVAQDSGCLASVAVLHANEAWAYAMLGAADRVCEAIARAESELARVNSYAVPSWARFFLAPADIDGLAAVAFTRLAAHKEHQSAYAAVAIDRATRSYQRRLPGETRSRTFDAISLATGYLLDTQLNQAEQHGHRAIDMASNVSSVRAIDRLRDLAVLATPYSLQEGIAEVRHRIATLSAS